MIRQLLLASLLLLALAVVAVPSASAYPNCEVQSNNFGIGVVCAGGAKPLGLCAFDLYDTPTVMWAIPGEYGCV